MVEGCVAGRAYSFSVRGCLPSGRSSEYSAQVTATAGKAGSLCSTAASVDTKGTEEISVVPVVGQVRVERVEEGCELPEKENKQVEAEVKSRFLPDEGCNLRKWLMDRSRVGRLR